MLSAIARVRSSSLLLSGIENDVLILLSAALLLSKKGEVLLSAIALSKAKLSMLLLLLGTENDTVVLLSVTLLLSKEGKVLLSAIALSKAKLSRSLLRLIVSPTISPVFSPTPV